MGLSPIPPPTIPCSGPRPAVAKRPLAASFPCTRRSQRITFELLSLCAVAGVDAMLGVAYRHPVFDGENGRKCLFLIRVQVAPAGMLIKHCPRSERANSGVSFVLAESL